MKRPLSILTGALLALVSLVSSHSAGAAEPGRRPNIIFIIADDLGVGHLGCYGQKKIQTPNIDRIAQDGVRFTQCYAGSCVCAPSRSTLMTGLHTGHTPIRANGGGAALRPEDVTVAKVLKDAGYATGGFGKWGLGIEKSTGHPNRQGFDEFFGYLHQVHAHFYYPYFLWKNEKRSPLPENEGRKQVRYSHDEIQKQVLAFIRSNKDRPFFCYVPYTIPHVELVVPEDSLKPYRGKWKETPLPDPRPGYIGADEPLATYAGMVSRMDGSVGEILTLLKELKIDENTLVIFTSDNGPQAGPWKPVADFFAAEMPLHGYKTEFYEGGIRVPAVARWPGKIKPGTTSDHVWAFWDVMPTLAEVAGAKTPSGIDGISFVPALLGQRDQKEHDFLYWEIQQGGGLIQAIRYGSWKYVKPAANKPFELYELAVDPGEKNNLVDRNAAIVAKIEAYRKTARTEPRKYEPMPAPTWKDYVK